MTYDWAEFDSVFGKIAKGLYTQNYAQTVSRNRQSLEGILFFDRFMGTIGCGQVASSYPPKSDQDLRKLHKAIVNASAADEQKQALLYYILKDCKPTSDQGEIFAKAVYLPPKYTIFIDGLHDLDHGETTHALEMLTDTIVPPIFLDQILYTLLQSPKVDSALAMAYCISVQTPFEDHKTLNAYFSMLCRADILYAYHFCQTRVNPQRKRLFEDMILSVFSSNDGSHASKAEALIGLPFTDQEVCWFEDCLLYGKGSSCHGGKDSVIMRRIGTGRDFTDVETMHQLREQKVDGVSWEDVASNFQTQSSGQWPR